jgi:hypothetical protein
MATESTTAQTHGNEVKPEETVAAASQPVEGKQEEQAAGEKAEGGDDYVMEERVIESEWLCGTVAESGSLP